MPSSTKKQRNFMAAIAHNPSFAKKVGIPQSVGKDFNEADKGRKFGRGGKINIQDTQHGKLDMPFKQLNRVAGMKEGGQMMMKRGMRGMPQGMPQGRPQGMPQGMPPAMAPRTAMPPAMPPAMKKGGNVKESKAMMGKEVAFMKKKGAPASMLKHEKAEMGMNMGGMSKYAKGGGIESRGKTKGTIIKMATGGSVGSASRRADGIAQRGKTRC